MHMCVHMCVCAFVFDVQHWNLILVCILINAHYGVYLKDDSGFWFLQERLINMT